MEHYSIAENVFVALRKIDRAIDLQSKKIKKKFGLTGPQLMVLKSIAHNSNMQISAIAKDVSLSQATVTSILDRLESQGFAKRQRSQIDKRKVTLVLTDKAQEVLDNDVNLLQEDFNSNFNKLETWEQMMILTSLNRLDSILNLESYPQENEEDK